MNKELKIAIILEIILSAVFFIIKRPVDGIVVKFGIPLNYISLFYKGNQTDSNIMTVKNILDNNFGYHINGLNFLISIAIAYLIVHITMKIYRNSHKN